MTNISNSLYNMRHLDDLARKDTSVHRINPLIKLLTTFAYMIMVISFGKYEIGNLLPFLLYPMIIFILAEIPIAPIFKRILIVEPLIIGIGILNPLFNHQTFVIGGMSISVGWITFLSILIRSTLTIVATLLLIATTGMDRLAAALRMLKIPKMFVLQLLLTYRYISVLLEEVARMLRAYSLRSLQQKGIHRSSWGSFAGQLILRTFDRAQRVYQAMCTRGFSGEYNTGESIKIRANDCVYLFGWILFFAVSRIYNIPMLIGSLFAGVIK